MANFERGQQRETQVVQEVIKKLTCLTEFWSRETLQFWGKKRRICCVFNRL